MRVACRTGVGTTVAIASACAAAWGGCSLYDRSLLVEVEASAGVDASEAATPCVRARWPARPAADSPGGAPNIDFYNALTSLDFGPRDGGSAALTGFDLDGVCTCPEGPSCTPASGNKARCDRAGGIDNSGEDLFAQLSQYPAFWSPALISERLSKGVFGGLIRVRGYNGGPDDTQVEVSFFASNGTEGAQSGLPKVPTGDGTDKWTLDPDSLLGGAIADGGPPIPVSAVDVSAYVAGGKLVAHLDLPIRPRAGTPPAPVTIELSGATIMATLTRSGSTFKMDGGVIAGRWQARKLLTALRTGRDPVTPTLSLCGTDPVYQQVKAQVCTLPDLATNVTDDGKGAPCDAVSVGLGFTAAPATFGSVLAAGDAGADTCGPQWTDSCPL